MIKIFYCFLTLSALCPALSFSQASDQQHFSLTLYFEKEVPADSLKVQYFTAVNNRILSAHYTVSKADNAITIAGENDFVTGFTFPALLFSYKVPSGNTGVTTGLEKELLFYFFSGSSSYGNRYSLLTRERMKNVRFSYGKRYMYYNRNNDWLDHVKDIELSLMLRSSSISNELITIPQ